MKTNTNILSTGDVGLQVLMLMAVMLVSCICPTFAQKACFEFEDNNETITIGLTAQGCAASSLTIPKEVTTVRSGAFSGASTTLSALVVEAGGNPTFESGLFDNRENPLSEIQIMGSSMTAANIRSLFASLGSPGPLSSVYIEGYSGEWEDIEESDILTGNVSVALPAALVSTQQFCAAKVYGRFEITKELITFCGNATFLDADDGSNMLFYVADGCNKDEGYVHIQRVHYVAKGRGVLIHNLTNTSTWADLLRYSTDEYTGTDAERYASNMLVGVTTPTAIGKTDGDKTNLVLSNGAFHPTSGGTIGANKAYLQVPTDMMAARELLTISFDDPGTSPITGTQEQATAAGWYDLQGRKLDGEPANKGIYVVNGKKFLKK